MRKLLAGCTAAIAVVVIAAAFPALADESEEKSDIEVKVPSSLNPPSMEGTLQKGFVEESFNLGGFALAKPVTPEEYVIGVGDRFLLCFWGKKDEKIALSVGPEGIMMVPNVGPIRAYGMTLAELKRRLKAKMKRLFPGVESDVFLLAPRVFKIEVFGQVRKPGIYVVTPLNRVSDAIARAGGIAPWGSERNITFETLDGDKLNADLLQYRIFGDTSKNPPLREGRITVGFRGRKVSISGEVMRPGTYELTDSEDFHFLLTVLAAGLTPYTSTTEPAKIVRPQNGKQVIITFDPHLAVSSKEYASQFVLKDRDSIHIPSLVRSKKTALVKGAIFGTGGLSLSSLKTDTKPMPRTTQAVIALREGDTVREVIMRAGGLCPWADLKRAYIYRQTAEGHSIVQLDLYRLFVEKDLSADVEVQGGDVIVIPTIDENVYVIGEVKRPGAFEYLAAHKTSEYIGLAGGPTSRAAMKRAYVLRDAEKLPIEDVAELEPGDTIVVPETRLKWWQDYLAITTGIATVILVGLAATN